METLRLDNRIVTDQFHVPAIAPAAGKGYAGLVGKPGLHLLAATMVRSSAHQILIPARKNSLKTSLKEFPLSLANRIKVVDSNGKLRLRVERYFEPIHQQLDPEFESDPNRRLMLDAIFDFVYKITIAIKYSAQADIPMIHHIPGFLNELSYSCQGEAKARLDLITGILNLYNRIETISVPMLRPDDVTRPDIYQRTNDILDDSEIKYYAQQRSLIGLRSMTSEALLNIKKWVRTVRRDPRYKKMFGFAAETLNLVGQLPSIPEVDITSNAIGKILSIFANPLPGFDPPLVDLDEYRIQIATRAYPLPPGNEFAAFIVMPRGGARGLNIGTRKWVFLARINC